MLPAKAWSNKKASLQQTTFVFLKRKLTFFFIHSGRRGRGRNQAVWKPVTRLGRLVDKNIVKGLDEIYRFSLCIKESQIVDELIEKSGETIVVSSFSFRLSSTRARGQFCIYTDLTSTWLMNQKWYRAKIWCNFGKVHET